MIIRKININSFGKLENFSLNFESGINIIYGPNEFGKSTIADFIKLMFYSKPRVPKEGKTLRTKYASWNGKVMSGFMEVEFNGNIYFIQKEFSTKSPSGDKSLLVNKTAGENIALGKEEEIGEHLFGIDVACYERSAYVGNVGNIDFITNGKSKLAPKDALADKIFSNFSDTGEENLSKSKIVRKITDEMKKLKTPGGRSGEILKIEAKISEIRQKMSDLDDFERSQENARAKLREIDALRDEYKKLELKLKNNENSVRAKEIEELIELIKGRTDVKHKIEQYGISFENFCSYFQPLRDCVKELSYINLKIRNCQKMIQDVTSEGNEPSSCQKISAEEKAIFEKKLENLKILENRAANINYLFLRKFDKKFEDLELNDVNGGLKKIESEVKHAEYAKNSKCTEADLMSKKHKINISVALALFGVSMCTVIICAILGMGHYSIFAICVLMAACILYIFAAQVRFKKKIKKINDLIKKLNSDIAVSNERISSAIVNYEKKTKFELEHTMKSMQNILREKNCASISEYYSVYANSAHIALLEHELKLDLNQRNKLLQSVSAYLSRNKINLDIDFASEHFETDFNTILELYEYIQKTSEQIDYKSKVLNVKGFDLKRLEEYCEKLKNTNQSISLSEDINVLESRFKILKSMNLEEMYISEYKSITATTMSRKNLESELSEQNLKKQRALERYLALKIASDTIEETSKDISKNLVPALSEKASEIFRNITDGKYSNVYMQKNYEMMIFDGNVDRPFNYFSRGTIDQVYFSLRMAISEIISRKSQLPFIFDDTFMQYDDKRLEKVLSFLEKYTLKSNSQAIIFTCHDYVRELYNKIKSHNN